MVPMIATARLFSTSLLPASAKVGSWVSWPKPKPSTPGVKPMTPSRMKARARARVIPPPIDRVSSPKPNATAAKAIPLGT
jgi:hypothetical protein